MKKYSAPALSNVCGMSPGRKTAVKGHSNRYASTAQILAFMLASNSALGYTDFGGTLQTPLPLGAASVDHVVNVEAGSCVIQDIDVILAYSHTFSADMDISLTAPDGTVVGLMFARGGSTEVEVNYPVTFDDESTNNPITDFHKYGTDSPKVTEFRSQGGTGYVTLGGLYGKAATGAWTLAMDDDCQENDTGSLHSATLRITCATEVPSSQPSISSQPSNQPTLSGKAGKGLKGPSKSGKGLKVPQVSAKVVKDPQIYGTGSKVEESNSQMEPLNAEGALDEVWAFANLEEQSMSMSL